MVHWGHTPFRVNGDPELGQPDADLTNDAVRLTQLWFIQVDWFPGHCWPGMDLWPNGPLNILFFFFFFFFFFWGGGFISVREGMSSKDYDAFGLLGKQLERCFFRGGGCLFLQKPNLNPRLHLHVKAFVVPKSHARKLPQNGVGFVRQLLDPRVC